MRVAGVGFGGSKFKVQGVRALRFRLWGFGVLASQGFRELGFRVCEFPPTRCPLMGVPVRQDIVFGKSTATPYGSASIRSFMAAH